MILECNKKTLEAVDKSSGGMRNTILQSAAMVSGSIVSLKTDDPTEIRGKLLNLYNLSQEIVALTNATAEPQPGGDGGQ
jgi:hypothetical protein